MYIYYENNINEKFKLSNNENYNSKPTLIHTKKQQSPKQDDKVHPDIKVMQCFLWRNSYNRNDINTMLDDIELLSTEIDDDNFVDSLVNLANKLYSLRTFFDFNTTAEMYSILYEIAEVKFYVTYTSNNAWNESKRSIIRSINQIIHKNTDDKNVIIDLVKGYCKRYQDILIHDKIILSMTGKEKRQEGSINKEKASSLTSVYGIFNILKDEQAKEFMENIKILKKYCNDKGVASVIEGAGTNVKKAGSILDKENDISKQIFISRFKLMTKFVQATARKKIGSKQICVDFDIESTGSDPHQNGEHALFLIHKKTKERKLFKPHSLMYENAISGNDGLIQYINSFSYNQKDKLPSMEINPENHTEEFVKRSGAYESPVSEETIHEQYKRLGRLEAVSAFAGVTDLHGENVMFTDKGPVIIDGECGGFYGSTGITQSSGVGDIGEDDQFTNPSALYTQKGGKPSQVLLKSEMKNFYLGNYYMKQTIINKKNKILEKYKEKLGTIDSFRVVPIPTNELAGALDAYLSGAKLYDIAKAYYTDAVKALTNKSWAFYSEKYPIKIIENEFITKFTNAFTAGTLPAFEFLLEDKGEFSAGSILLDGKSVGGIAEISKGELKLLFLERAKNKIDEFKEELEYVNFIANNLEDNYVTNQSNLIYIATIIYNKIKNYTNVENTKESAKKLMKDIKPESNESKINATINKLFSKTKIIKLFRKVRKSEP